LVVFENNVWRPEVVYVYLPAGGVPGGDVAGARVVDEEEPVGPEPPEPPAPLAVRAWVVGDADLPEPPDPDDPTVDTEVAAGVVVVATVEADPRPTWVDGVLEPPPDDPGPGETVGGAPAPPRWSRWVVPIPMAAPTPTTRSAAAKAPTALTPVVLDKSLI
jgi:hypothetical protein